MLEFVNATGFKINADIGVKKRVVKISNEVDFLARHSFGNVVMLESDATIKLVRRKGLDSVSHQMETEHVCVCSKI